MRVLMIGAGGFLGSRLARRICADGRIGPRAVGELVLFDQRSMSSPPAAACRVATTVGNLRDTALLGSVFEQRVDLVFHLAATLTLEAQHDPRLGLETNVLALIDLLERCRALPTAPMLIFASSIATFGGDLPAIVDDDVFQAPTTSYGAHKVVAEQLLADYTRHGAIDGRALRLPIVLTHPGPANGSISDQVASLIREPLRGGTVSCGIAPDTPLVVASVDNVVDSFLRLASLPDSALREARTMNLPGLTVTPAEIERAVLRRLPPGRPQAVRWRSDPRVQASVASWPSAFDSARARALGFVPDASADAIVDAFVAADQAPAA